MISNVGEVVKAKEMKFLFVFNTYYNATMCCCGCTLRDGLKFITIPYIILILVYIVGLSDHYNMYIGLPFIILNFFQLTGPIMLLYASCTNNFKYSYYGTVIFQIFIYIGIAESIFNGITFKFFTTPFLIAYIFSTIFLECIYIYCCFIAFSFTKELGKGNLTALDSKVVMNSLAGNPMNENFDMGQLGQNITIRNLSHDADTSRSSEQELGGASNPKNNFR